MGLAFLETQNFGCFRVFLVQIFFIGCYQISRNSKITLILRSQVSEPQKHFKELTKSLTFPKIISD